MAAIRSTIVITTCGEQARNFAMTELQQMARCKQAEHAIVNAYGWNAQPATPVPDSQCRHDVDIGKIECLWAMFTADQNNTIHLMFKESPDEVDFVNKIVSMG